MEIREIKSSLNILTVLQHYNLSANKNGMLKCPFHEDKDPSLKVYTDTNTFNCFGCGKAGDQIEFIQLKENCCKRDAIMKAKTLVNPNEPVEPIKKKSQDKNLLPRIAVLGKVAQDSKASFKRTVKAKDYIRTRKLNPDVLEVGYIGSEFGKKWNEQLKQSALSLGIFKEYKQNIVPKFKNCVLFFTKNEKGQIIDLYGRSINPNGAGKHFYLNGKHQGIYPNYPETKATKIILVESLIDAATLKQQTEIDENYTILSLFGTNGFTLEIETAIKELKELEEVIIFFDGDKAGNEAAIKTAGKLKTINPKLTLSKVETPEEEDINSLLQGHEPEILNHLINERKPISNKTKEQRTDTQAAPEPSQLNTENPDKITYQENQLHFIIWGGIEKENIHRLKINLLVQVKSKDYRYYQDDVNLYSNGQLQRYIKGAAEELETSGTLLKNTIRKLKNQIESYRLTLIEEQRKALAPKPYQMNTAEQKEALRFLKAKNLVKNTMSAISKSGLIGEQQNGLLLFFLYLSRLFEDPLHAIIFGKSGSGKTYLQTKISECLPEESVRTITSLTENTLYYSAKNFWKHKLLLIEDLEGVYNAFLPLREFMSKQSISKLTTDKDAKGNNVQKVLMVEGPICVSGATTKANIYEDNANRSFLLHVDETPNHAKQVMDYQRQLQAGLVNESQQNKYKQLLQNTQRLLKQVRVINPYAPMLDIPECVFKKLRTNMHYLRLIEIITFYHQHQREVKTDKSGKAFITTTPEDIAWANYLIKDSLLRKSDELGGQVRHFFESLKSFADKKEEPKTIYAKEVREAFRMNPMTINRYLRELESRGYIQRNGGNRKTGFEYEIKAWDEYEKLKSGIDILDEILEKVKMKYNSQNKPKAQV
nr:CHC2 zinc finger domain-containing protein [uncultured Marinifilum sp.]